MITVTEDKTQDVGDNAHVSGGEKHSLLNAQLVQRLVLSPSNRSVAVIVPGYKDSSAQ